MLPLRNDAPLWQVALVGLVLVALSVVLTALSWALMATVLVYTLRWLGVL